MQAKVCEEYRIVHLLLQRRSQMLDKSITSTGMAVRNNANMLDDI